MRRLLLVVLLLASSLALAGDRQSVLIRTPKPYDKVVAAIQALGGTVTYQYKYVNGIAAQLPLSALPKIEALVGADNLSKDDIQTIPAPSNRFGKTEVLDDSLASASADAVPADYDFDNALMHTNTLRASGYTGSGIVVAVIDSGYRPMFTHVPASRVLAGLNMVPDSAEPGKAFVGAVDDRNYAHGTQVAGLIAANYGLCFYSTSKFATLARAFGGGIADSPACGGTGTTVVWELGTAPAATIFPVKVFPTSGAGAPSSRIIQAMEAVIDKRVAYDNGDTTNGVNIRAANMSLGGPTGIAGRGLEDEAADAMLAHDILLAVAAGNDGFSNMTISEPGTSFSALTVGAASNPSNWRIVLGGFSSMPCYPSATAALVSCVTTYYPDNTLQMADFSSRGPTHDGRIKPDVVANGSWNLVQGSGSSYLSYGSGSGTSYATPLVTGLAASLRQAVPTATARQIRNAIIASANPNLIPTATVFHQGAGFVDATAALALLQAGGVPDTVRTDFPYARSVVDNVTNAGLQVSSGFQSRTVTVRPGELAEITYNVDKNTDKLFVRFHNVTPGATQNAFFGDDVYLRIQSSFVEGKDYRVAGDWITGDATYSFDKPMQGLWRITPSGDYTNLSPITFTVDVWTSNDPSPQQSAKNKIAAEDWQYLSFSVKPGTKSLDVLGSWMNQYDSYPVNDIDFYLVAPDGTVFTDCATGNAPERCSVANPKSGIWQVAVNGFAVNTLTTPGGREVYTLRIAADGTVIPAK